MGNRIFQCGKKILKGDAGTLLCGIINATPDSFSDGGRYMGTEKALKRAGELIAGGARMLDIGGESTRPGSTPVSPEEEAARVVPVIKAIREAYPDILISVDTFKAHTAKAAIDAGCDIINDITGLMGDPLMADVIADSDAGLILMFNPVIIRPDHPGSRIFPDFYGNKDFRREDLDRIQNLPVTRMMQAYFDMAIHYAEAHGIAKERIMLDPGIGFGLTKNENFTLIRDMEVLKAFGLLTFLGVSRKRFIVNLLGENGIETDLSKDDGLRNVDAGSACLSAIAAKSGVSVLRVHDAARHRAATEIGNAVRLAENMVDKNFGSYKEKK